MCKGILNGRKIPDAEFNKLMLLIPPVDYESLLPILKDKGYTVIKHSHMTTNPYKLTLTKLSVICLSDFDTWVMELEKICGKKFRVAALPNLNEIYISLTN